MADSSQRQDPENLQNPENDQGGREPSAGRANPEGATDQAYDPSTVEVNRGREQGLGVGHKDIDYQRDATGYRSDEQYSDATPAGGTIEHAQGGPSGLESQAGPPGPRDRGYDDRDRDEVSTDWPAG
jgi:hypothetical protein